MKSFLEEYGFAILAAIVVILLIAMCTPVGNLIKNQVMGVVDSFAGRTESKLANIDDSDVKVYAEEDPAGTAKITLLTVPSTTNVYHIRTRVNGGAWSEYSVIAKGGSKSVEGQSKQKVEFEIVDTGTQQLVSSGSITLK